MNTSANEVDVPLLEGETSILLPINAVERETGVTKELLRMWERRYGFPAPLRDAQGDRIYPMDQVNKLRLLRRLVDYGFRPGKIINNDLPELERLLRSQGKSGQDTAPMETELLEALKTRDSAQLHDYLAHQLTRLGLQRFITDFLQPATTVIGDAWMHGAVAVHEEHLFTEQVQTLVRQAIGNLRDARKPPRILLATPPGETHTLGLLMIEAMLRLDDVDAVCYGAEMAVRDISQAVQRSKINIAAISFSASFPTTKAIEFLEELRFRLPLAIDIWAGGASLRSTRRSVEAVRFLHDLPAMAQAVTAWRRQHSVR